MVNVAHMGCVCMQLMQGISASLQDQACPNAAVPTSLISTVQALDKPCIIPPAVLDSTPATCSQAQPAPVSSMHQSLQGIGALCRPNTPGLLVAASFRSDAPSSPAVPAAAAPSTANPMPLTPSAALGPAPARTLTTTSCSSSLPPSLSTSAAAAAPATGGLPGTAVRFMAHHPDEQLQVFAYQLPQAKSPPGREPQNEAPIVTGLSPSPTSAGSMERIQAACSGGGTSQGGASKGMHASSSGRKPYASLLQAARDLPRHTASGAKPGSQNKSSSKAPASDSFAGFLHQQASMAEWPLGHSQNALWPEASSSQGNCASTSAPQQPLPAHDLTVGMVLTGSIPIPASRTPLPRIPAEHTGPRQHPADQAASKETSRSFADQGESSTALQQDPDLTASTSLPSCSGSIRGPESLAGGAVLLQNPDGSTQYVLLTSEDQIAVQLILQARHDRLAQQAGRAESYQVHWSSM